MSAGLRPDLALISGRMRQNDLPGALIQAWKYFVTGDGGSFRAIMMVVMIALLLVVIAATISIPAIAGALSTTRGAEQTDGHDDLFRCRRDR